MTIDELDRLAATPKDQLRSAYPDHDYTEIWKLWRHRRKVIHQRKYRQIHKGEWGGGLDLQDKARMEDARRGSERLRVAILRALVGQVA